MVMMVDAKTQGVAGAIGKQHPKVIELDTTTQGKIQDTTKSAMALMQDVGGLSLRWNNFSKQVEFELPPEFAPPSPLGDDEIHFIRKQIFESTDKISNLSSRHIWEAAHMIAMENSYDPIQDYLKEISGSVRNTDILETWLINLYDLEDTPYHRAVSRLTILGAAKRALYPGCQFQTALVLESIVEGKNKSSLCRALAPNPELFTDSVDLKMGHKELIEETCNALIVELPELTGMRKSDLDHVKTFISRRQDSARLAFGHTSSRRPRRFIFIGTSNDTSYLKSQGRRFWPVRVRKSLKDTELKHFEKEIKPVLWNEAFKYVQEHRESTNVTLPQSLWETAGDEQAKRFQMPNPEWQLLIPILRKSMLLMATDLNSLFFPNSEDINDWRPHCMEFRQRGEVLKGFTFQPAKISPKGTITFADGTPSIKTGQDIPVGRQVSCWAKSELIKDWKWEAQCERVRDYLDSVEIPRKAPEQGEM